MRYIFIVLIILFSLTMKAQRPRDLGIQIGILKTGKYNAITDVNGVLIGQKTLNKKEKY